jgi:pimeloyl-ACP methyl ester carboxylesterase
VDTTVIELPDGRELAFSEAGDEGGTPVLAFHGTPGSRRQLLLEPVGKAAHALGARLIAPDRPGYGHSTFQAGRRIADWAADVEVLADRLELERFSVLGFSGGGPHALACAALLPLRVTRAVVVSGIGPMPTSAETEGMSRPNQVLSALARRSEFAVLPVTALVTNVARRRPEQSVRSMSKQLPPSDAAVLERPEVFGAFVDDVRLASGTAARAVAQDLSLFTQPWGFDLRDVAVPVDFWQGDADRNVPPVHARRQAEQVKRSTLHEVSAAGHFMAFDHIEEILQAALA